jgi:predicted CoA-substrate-specific enzyme activase
MSMLVAGCDVGSLTAKAVLLENGKLLSSAVMRAGPRPKESAEAVLEKALASAGRSARDIALTVGTGYGRNMISFAQRTESEITCAARGIHNEAASVRTVIDIGGQDAKVIKLDSSGGVARYIYNDKCASGTGRFIEIIADVLGIPLEEMGAMAVKSTNRLNISNQCVIFAETEIISLVNEGRNISDIANGLHHAVANRIVSMAGSIGIEKDIAITGGVAKNPGMMTALGEALKSPLTRLGMDPQIIAAYGAALIAQDSQKT